MLEVSDVIRIGFPAEKSGDLAPGGPPGAYK